MAENKKSFLLYCDSYSMVKQLPDDVAGRLLKHIFAYVNDENPVTDELLINIAFEPIKQQLKRDLIKYNEFVKKQSINGSLGGRPKTQINPKKALGFLDNPNKPKKADSVTDSVNVIDNVNVIKKNTITSLVEKKQFEGSPYGDGELHYLVIEFAKKNKEKYPKDFYYNFLEYWTGKIQFGSKKGFELWRTEKTFTLGGRLATSFRMTWDKPNGVQVIGQPKKGKIQTMVENSNEAVKELLAELGGN